MTEWTDDDRNRFRIHATGLRQHVFSRAHSPLNCLHRIVGGVWLAREGRDGQKTLRPFLVTTHQIGPDSLLWLEGLQHGVCVDSLGAFSWAKNKTGFNEFPEGHVFRDGGRTMTKMTSTEVDVYVATHVQPYPTVGVVIGHNVLADPLWDHVAPEAEPDEPTVPGIL